MRNLPRDVGIWRIALLSSNASTKYVVQNSKVYYHYDETIDAQTISYGGDTAENIAMSVTLYIKSRGYTTNQIINGLTISGVSPATEAITKGIQGSGADTTIISTRHQGIKRAYGRGTVTGTEIFTMTYPDEFIAQARINWTGFEAGDLQAII